MGFIWALGKLPQRLGLALARPLGALLHRAMKRRRRIAERNIARCFPHMTVQQQARLVRGCFHSLARTVFEIAWSWSAPDQRFRRFGEVQGLEHLQAARQQGQGVLMVTAHISCLEIGGRLLAMAIPVSGIYRPLRSPVLEWYQNRSRLAYGESMISKRDMRSAIRLLKRGGMIWYAPDQDFGAEQSAFVPFFGIQTATLLATHRLARMTGCAVLPMFPVYDEASRRYTVRILPALEGFAGEGAEACLARINAIMEAHIRESPEQYWWIHRRFKTRPADEAPFYD